VVGGIFKLFETFGLPLDIIFDLCKRNNLVIDWIDFFEWSQKVGWSQKTLFNRIEHPLIDVYGTEYTTIILKRLRKL